MGGNLSGRDIWSSAGLSRGRSWTGRPRSLRADLIHLISTPRPTPISTGTTQKYATGNSRPWHGNSGALPCAYRACSPLATERRMRNKNGTSDAHHSGHLHPYDRAHCVLFRDAGRGESRNWHRFSRIRWAFAIRLSAMAAQQEEGIARGRTTSRTMGSGLALGPSMLRCNPASWLVLNGGSV